MITNNRNIETAKIGMWFLVARNDVANPRFCTSEPSDHNLCNWRTTLEVAELEEKAQQSTKEV